MINNIDLVGVIGRTIAIAKIGEAVVARDGQKWTILVSKDVRLFIEVGIKLLAF